MITFRRTSTEFFRFAKNNRRIQISPDRRRAIEAMAGPENAMALKTSVRCCHMSPYSYEDWGKS